MRKMKLHLALAALTSLAMAGSAQAVMVAGWDFSQYAGENYMDTDESGEYKNTLPSNYSDLDPTFGAGYQGATPALPGSQQYGTLYFDGSFGSTNLPDLGSVSGDFAPIDISLDSNEDAPGTVDFDSFSVLGPEGQTYTNALKMTYVGDAIANIVFQVDLSSEGPYTDWELAFGGRTLLSGTFADVSIAFATSLGAPDSPNFGANQIRQLNFTDSKVTVDLDGLDGLDSALAWIRLGFTGTGGQPIIDNVSVNATFVPEPATALMVMVGLLGLGYGGRRRS
jgi:hypothetical protein